MSKQARLFAAVAIAAVAAQPASANHSWSTYHWPITGENTTFDVYTALTQTYWRSMTDSTGPTPRTADIIDEARRDWGTSSSDPQPGTGTVYKNYLKPHFAGTRPQSEARKCNPISGAIFVCSDSYGFRGWLGIASIWLNGSHITQATTKLNESYHNSGTYSSYSWRAAVACQEIGHDFGLGHQNEDFNTDETESCMEYTNRPLDNESPDWHDFQQLQTIYDAHLAESPGSGGGGGGGGPGNGKGPNKLDPFAFREVGKPLPSESPIVSDDWGTAIAFDAHGRPNVFELQIRQGFRKITHVTWVPGFRPERHHMKDD